MKVLSRFQAWALLALGVAAFCSQAGAQTLRLSASASATTVGVNNPVTFTIGVTNQTGSQTTVFVTNIFSLSFTVQSSTGNLFFDGTNQVFAVGSMLPGNVAVMSLTGIPTATGTLNNQIVAASSPFAPVTTNVAVTVTNTPQTIADLAVGITGPLQPVLLNDYMTFGVSANNLGPGSVSGVVITNSASTNIFLIAHSPTNQSTTLTTNGFFLINVGALTNAAVRNFSITAQPLHTGPLTLFATIGASGTTDSNASNNVVSTNLTILDLVTNDLIATNVSAMVLNRQNALMEQTIRLVNVSPSNVVASARVIVKGLTNALYNAVGTNTLGTTNRYPFVVYPAPLAPGDSVDLVLQYFVPNRQPITVPDSSYVAVSTPAVETNVLAQASLVLTNYFLPDGSMLIQFPATVGLTYQIQYCADSTFSTNVLLAQPPVIALANWVQWIDHGPPSTISPPMSVPARFYRVQVKP